MKKAFSLIEMIVVVGIIAVLAAVLIPALSGSSDSAKAAKCLSNMHSLASGVQAYAMATTKFPLAGSRTHYNANLHSKGTHAEHGWVGWSSDSANGSYISPYSNDKDARFLSLTNGVIWNAVSRNREVYVCPTHREKVRAKKGGKDKYGPCWSYAMNAWFGWSARSTPYKKDKLGPKYEDVADKSKTLLFAELPFIDCESGGSTIQSADYGDNASASNDPILQYQDCEGANGASEVIGFNHKQGKREIFAHVCFADGHTEKLRLPRNASVENLKQLTRWLCYPKTDDGKRFDIVIDGDEYKIIDN